MDKQEKELNGNVPLAPYQPMTYVMPMNAVPSYPYLTPQPPQTPYTQEMTPKVYYQQVTPTQNVNTTPNDNQPLITDSAQDERELGSFSDFMLGMAFGIAAPVFSSAAIFGMETSQLMRLGNMFGTSDLVLMLSLWCFVAAPWAPALLILGVIFFVAAIVLFVCTTKKFYKPFLAEYQKVTPHSSASVKISSKVGEKKDYWWSFFFSLFLSCIGALIRVIYNKSLWSRYGALMGLAYNFLFFGGIFVMLDFGLHFLIGLVLLQCTVVHFRRAFICARAEIL